VTKKLQFFVQVGDLSFSPSPRTFDLGRGYFVADLNGDRKTDVLLTETATSFRAELLLNSSR
jgi:hypothetical protein